MKKEELSVCGMTIDPFWTKQSADRYPNSMVLEKLVYRSVIGLRKRDESVESIVLTDSMRQVTLEPIGYDLEAFICEIGYFFPNLKHIAVTERLYHTRELFTVDGCLYTASGGSCDLLHCPAGRTGTYSLPEGTVRIGWYAFAHSRLEEVLFPESLREIDEYAFDSSRIARLHIPAGVTLIGDQGCENPAPNCRNLTSISIDPGNKRYYVKGNCLYSRRRSLLLCYPAGLTSDHFALPATCRDLGYRAFDGTAHLKRVSLHTQLTSIGYKSFYHASITEIDTPASVDYLDEQAFEGCEDLRTVIIRDDGACFAEGDFGPFRECSGSLRIVANPGSSAEEYAREMGFAFIDLKEYEKTV